MKTVNELLGNIREGLTQQSASKKDEVDVMQMMLNDKTYSVDVYDKTGVVGQFCPSTEARGIITSVLENTAHMSSDEAIALSDSHEFSQKEAARFVNISKEYVNTYLETNRRLPLGGRSESNVTLMKKIVEESTRSFPAKDGVDGNGETIYVTKEVTVPKHQSVKVFGSCPDWLK